MIKICREIVNFLFYISKIEKNPLKTIDKMKKKYYNNMSCVTACFVAP